jgi:hypothetical protein
MALGRALLFSVVAGALLLGSAPPAAADGGKGVITLSDGDWGMGRPLAYLASHRRTLEIARSRLQGCYELALAEFARTSTEVDADIAIAANGEVASVTVSSHGAVGEATLRCVRHRLANLQFDPPGGTGVALRVAIVMGEPAAEEQPALPFRVESELNGQRLALGPIVMRLSAPPASPAAAATRLAKNATEACAKSRAPARAVVVTARLFVTEDGGIAKAEAASLEPGGEPIAKCLREAKWHGDGLKVERVEVKLAVSPKGEVSFAR